MVVLRTTGVGMESHIVPQYYMTTMFTDTNYVLFFKIYLFLLILDFNLNIVTYVMIYQ